MEEVNDTGWTKMTDDREGTTRQDLTCGDRGPSCSIFQERASLDELSERPLSHSKSPPAEAPSFEAEGNQTCCLL